MNKIVQIILDLPISLSFRWFIFFFRLLPLPVVHLFALALGVAFYLASAKRRKRIREHLDIVYPEGAPFDKRTFVREVFVHLAFFLMELLLAKPLFEKGKLRGRIDGPGIPILREIRRESPRAVFVSAHFGGIPILAYILGDAGLPISLVVRPVELPRFYREIGKTLEWSMLRLVFKKDAYAGLKEILSQESGYPTILIDQHGGRNSLAVDFLGHRAYTAAGAFALARRFRVPMFLLIFVRRGFFRYRFWVEKIPTIVTEDKQADLEAMATKANEVLGRYILRNPEQWFWMHRRWRKYPEPKILDE